MDTTEMATTLPADVRSWLGEQATLRGVPLPHVVTTNLSLPSGVNMDVKMM